MCFPGRHYLALFNTGQLACGRTGSMFIFLSAVEGESRLAEFSVTVA